MPGWVAGRVGATCAPLCTALAGWVPGWVAGRVGATCAPLCTALAGWVPGWVAGRFCTGSGWAPLSLVCSVAIGPVRGRCGAGGVGGSGATLGSSTSVISVSTSRPSSRRSPGGATAAIAADFVAVVELTGKNCSSVARPPRRRGGGVSSSSPSSPRTCVGIPEAGDRSASPIRSPCGPSSVSARTGLTPISVTPRRRRERGVSPWTAGRTVALSGGAPSGPNTSMCGPDSSSWLFSPWLVGRPARLVASLLLGGRSRGDAGSASSVIRLARARTVSSCAVVVGDGTACGGGGSGGWAPMMASRSGSFSTMIVRERPTGCEAGSFSICSASAA